MTHIQSHRRSCCSFRTASVVCRYSAECSARTLFQSRAKCPKLDGSEKIAESVTQRFSGLFGSLPPSKYALNNTKISQTVSMWKNRTACPAQVGRAKLPSTQ